MGEKTLKELATDMENKDMKELKNNIDALEQVLNEDVQKARMPENVFKNNFLPSLSGVKKDGDVMVAKYIEYAGGPYNEVDILDREGNLVYTCPPLYKRSEGTDRSKIPYSEVAGTYELKKSRLPAEAENYMNTVVGGIRQDVKVESGSHEFRWGKIIDRYKEPEIDEDSIIGPSRTLNNTSVDSIDDDLVNYD